MYLNRGFAVYSWQVPFFLPKRRERTAFHVPLQEDKEMGPFVNQEIAFDLIYLLLIRVRASFFTDILFFCGE
jgi:hypothetical protein